MTYYQPLTVVFLTAAIIGLVRSGFTRKSLLAWVGIFGLLALYWYPISWLLARPLEGWYPVKPFPSESAEAIVVLGSAVRPPLFERPYVLPDKDTYERCEYAAWLHSHWRPVPVLASGGGVPGRSTVSATMRQLLQRSGVPADMIWTEDVSRSTYENAVYSAQVLRARGISKIALVVEAQSMWRAAACFEKQGITVVPAPSSFTEVGKLEDWIPTWKAAAVNEITLHETLALAWYGIRGWI